ncbi:MAG: VOC family protein [Phyllobacteriaceae bacterium]|nr:VOC family protein [Phyllobacteriaceae bacterium]
MTRQAIVHVQLVVPDYDEALAFYVGVLGFRVVEDVVQAEQDKRWVVIEPPGAAGGASLVLGRATNDVQRAAIGAQTGGRVFLFLSTDDFARDHAAMMAKGVRFVREPKTMDYGRVGVFSDPFGNLWDLVEFAPGHRLALS